METRRAGPEDTEGANVELSRRGHRGAPEG
jgi:hypothetical protein